MLRHRGRECPGCDLDDQPPRGGARRVAYREPAAGVDLHPGRRGNGRGSGRAMHGKSGSRAAAS